MNIFLTNLACADLLILIFCLPPTVINDVTKTFWFSELFCKSILFFQNTSVYVSVLSLMFITFERWRAITCPLKSPLKATRYIIAGTWIAAMIMSSPEPFTLHLKRAEFRRPNFSTTWGTRCIASWSSETEQQYQIVLTLCAYLSPLLFISVLCLHMRRTLNRCELTIGKRQLANRKKAVRMLMAVVCVFALSYFPVHLHNIAATFDLLSRDSDINWIYVRKLLPRVFSYSSSCLNPLLYNFMCSKFSIAMSV
uniref:G_PROTEIN_RECEP_F1_2 domain-containing protein n=1 Tax=Angiostrongylus cantonensis TaxID=6313 RepID=A0A158P9Q5_ANGCA